jgi:DNA-directed RNA polymerase subunit omega
LPQRTIDRRANKSVDNDLRRSQSQRSIFMIALQLMPSALAASAPTILQFPTEAIRAVRSLRHMTTQLLQEAAKIIPNQQLLINVVSKRVRQLGLGHRPMVETTPRMSLTDIALTEIIEGKLAYEPLQGSADNA